MLRITKDMDLNNENNLTEYLLKSSYLKDIIENLMTRKHFIICDNKYRLMY